MIPTLIGHVLKVSIALSAVRAGNKICGSRNCCRFDMVGKLSSTGRIE